MVDNNSGIIAPTRAIHFSNSLLGGRSTGTVTGMKKGINNNKTALLPGSLR